MAGHYASARTLRSPLPFHELILLLFLVVGSSAMAAAPPVAPPMTHLLGSVTDHQGKPVAGALVGIGLQIPGDSPSQRNGLPLFTKADTAGRFDLAIPRSLGTVTLVARRAGFAHAVSRLIKLGAARVDVPPLKLASGLKLVGRVIDEQRRPIADAVVQATLYEVRKDTTGAERQPVRTRSQRDGSFVIAGLDSGDFGISAYGGDYALSFKVERVDSAAGSRRLEITLKKGVYLAGTVLDVAGHPLAGVKLANSPPNSIVETISDRRGRFRLGPFAPEIGTSIDAKLEGYTLCSAWISNSKEA